MKEWQGENARNYLFTIENVQLLFFFFLPAGRMKIEIDAPAKGIHIVPNKDCHSSFETVPGKQRIVNCV